jgi:hypothetical protein
MNHSFFFYNNLKDKTLINKVHESYLIHDAHVFVKDHYLDGLYGKKSFSDNEHKIKIQGKYVKFYNITMDDILNKINTLHIGTKKKYNMFETKCYLDKESHISNDNVWIII